MMTLHEASSRRLGISNSWLAWQVDNAVLMGGRMLEAAASETDTKGKPKRTLESVLEHGTHAVLSQSFLVGVVAMSD